MANAKHHERLAAFFKVIYDQKLFCDVNLELNGELFPAHRPILMCYSAYFQGKLGRKSMDGKVVSVNLDQSHIQRETLQRVLTFMYIGSIPLTESTVGALLRAATQFGIRSLLERCEHFLWNMKPDPAENALAMMKICGEHDLIRLQSEALSVYERSYGSFYDSAAFLQTSADTLTTLLRNSFIPFVKASDKFKAILSWLLGDAKRLHQLEQVLDAVLFEDMKVVDLMECSEITSRSFTRPDQIQIRLAIDRYLKDVLWDHTFRKIESVSSKSGGDFQRKRSSATLTVSDQDLVKFDDLIRL